MHKHIIWSLSVENDLEKILDYLSSKWNNKTANHFIDKIDIWK
jgi:plasmid stabilization system protein ParE